MKAWHDVAAGGAFLALGVGAAIIGWDFRGGAAGFPVVVGGVMTVLALVLIGRGLLASSTRTMTEGVDHWPRLLITLLALSGYLMALPRVGFFTASSVFVPALALILGFRRPLFLTLSTVLFITLLYALFTFLLRRPLPTEFFLAA